jgi:hypothetical protein
MIGDYERAETVSKSEVKVIAAFAHPQTKGLEDWLRQNWPEF